MSSESGPSPSEGDLTTWLADGLGGRGTPLLTAGQVRALQRFADRRSMVVCVLEAYEIRGDLEVPALELSVYADDDYLAHPDWSEVRRRRTEDIAAALLAGDESGRTLRYQAYLQGPPVAPMSSGMLLAALPGYVELLEACVSEGASIGFLHPMPAGEAEGFWRGVAEGVAAGDILMWSVTDGTGPLGTIQLHPVGKPNGADRAEIAKLMVHPRARGRGLAKVLMQTAEDTARSLGRRLLVLDTVEGGVADRLYRKLGWTEAGRIPDFALKSGGGSEATVVFWKRL